MATVTLSDVESVRNKVDLGGPWISSEVLAMCDEMESRLLRDDRTGSPGLTRADKDVRLQTDKDVRVADVQAFQDWMKEDTTHTLSIDDVDNLCNELLIAWDHVEALQGDEHEAGRRSVLGPKGGGEVWTVERVKAYLDEHAHLPSHPGQRQLMLSPLWSSMVEAIAGGRCDDPRGCCALLV